MKKIAVNTVKAFLKGHKTEDTFVLTFPIGDSSFEVKVRTSLTTDEESTFIRRVLSGCFDAAGNYRPEYVNPMIRATVLQMCTNLPVISLKGEQGDDGESLMDLDAMNELYFAMELDHLDNEAFSGMLMNLNDICYQAIKWKKNRMLSERGTDNAIRNFLDTLTAKVQSMNTSELLQYAGQLSEVTKGLDEGGILKGLLELREREKTA